MGCTNIIHINYTVTVTLSNKRVMVVVEAERRHVSQKPYCTMRSTVVLSLHLYAKHDTAILRRHVC